MNQELPDINSPEVLLISNAYKEIIETLKRLTESQLFESDHQKTSAMMTVVTMLLERLYTAYPDAKVAIHDCIQHLE